MIIKTIPVGMLQTNCYIVACDNTKEAIVIDPGDEADKILKEIKAGGYNVKQIIITHNHPDHIAALDKIKKETLSKVFIGNQEFNYNNLHTDGKLKNGEVYEAGSLKYKIMHTPGHTPGSVCLVFEDEKVIFSGDVLFNQGIGRTDLPGGSMEDMEASLEKLFALDDEYAVYPGHGPATTIGNEK